MTLLFSVLCFVVAFAPAFAIFVKIVTRDALRTILFFLGSFFWLLSVLVASLFALVAPSIVPVLFISAGIQEMARVGYFVLLHVAQRDLEKMAANRFASLRTSLASRHTLAVVCGLGFGVTAALFLLVNVLADYSGHGVVGLPASVPQIGERLPIKLTIDDAAFPLFYSLSNSILILNNVVWTVSLWDACHNYVNRLQKNWYVGATCPVLLHLINNLVSTGLRYYRFATLVAQVVILLVGLGHAYLVVKKPRSLRAFEETMGIVVSAEPRAE